ncbi:MAG: hypothetical protein Q3976_01080 [Corynebacterium sp.]|nr:hypothetical protein [Corynebacterium sp.]
MSFYIDLATALDAADIAARVQGSTLYVPINPQLEMQFVAIDEQLPAANVYIASAAAAENDVDAPTLVAGDDPDNDEDFVTTLVAVVFSVDDAVAKVEEILATEQVVDALENLLLGDDPRLAQLDFYQDLNEPFQVCADIASRSQLQVVLAAVDGEPVANVSFLTLGSEEREATSELSEANPDVEVLQLGEFHDFELLLEALHLASEKAEEWEVQLSPVE